MSETLIVIPTTVNRDKEIERASRLLSGLGAHQPWAIRIAKHVLPRTDLQNSALWGVAYKAIREASGNDPDDMHEYFCGEWFGWVEKEVFGAIKKKPRRTTTHNESGERNVMPVDDFCNFYAFIQQRMAEHGIFVPDPDPRLRVRAA